MLIQITASLIVAPSQIVKASRCGNYTEIWLSGDSPGCSKQIWDVDMKLWDEICRWARPCGITLKETA